MSDLNAKITLNTSSTSGIGLAIAQAIAGASITGAALPMDSRWTAQ